MKDFDCRSVLDKYLGIFYNHMPGLNTCLFLGNSRPSLVKYVGKSSFP